MKRIIIATFLVIGLTLSLVLLKPNSNYQKIEKEELKSSNLIAIYLKDTDEQEYHQVNEIPNEGNYALNKENSYCLKPDNKENKIKDMLEYNEYSKTLSVSKLEDNNTKCYLYFDKKKTSNEVLSNLGLQKSQTGCPTENNGEVTVNGIESSKKLICSAQDDDGESYYFRGATDNNWVKFGKNGSQDIWWRIIRINGDGTIRLIYAGVGSSAPNNNGTNALNSIAYNIASNDNAYVGYYYGTTEGSDFNKTHSNITPSNIATKTENWFTGTNLDEPTQLNHIDENAGFCNNRQISDTAQKWWYREENDNRGTGKVWTAYKGFYNIWIISESWRTDVNYASLKCSSADNFEDNVDYKRDYYTWEGHAKRGNQKLKQPVGQITADEVTLAGGFGNQANSGYWLNVETWYWTMSPNFFGGGVARVYLVINSGYLADNGVSYANGVRPVINLKSDTQFEPSNEQAEWGTKNNPFVVKIN